MFRDRWAFAIVLVAACAAAKPPPTGSAAPPGPIANAEAASAASIEDAAAPPALPVAALDTPADAPVDLDVVYWATPQPVVDKMLEIAEIQPSDILYDLGCGDGRILVTAAKRYGNKGFGFDLDPRRVREARENARDNGVEDLVQIERADIFKLDLSPANVVFMFLLPQVNVRLMPQLKKLRRGSRIVSHEFSMAGAKPKLTARVHAAPDGPAVALFQSGTEMHTVHLWEVPWQKQPKTK
jgi:SAM-dependent methyltransferase